MLISTKVFGQEVSSVIIMCLLFLR